MSATPINVKTHTKGPDAAGEHEDWDDSALADVEELLSNIDWKATGDAAALEARLHGELSALEAANIHAIIESEENVLAIVRQIDKAMVELDAMESWVSLYATELEARGKDVHQIESRNKGLQVQAVNQKNLLGELETFLNSISIPEATLDILRQESLESVAGVARIEDAAATLQKALLRKFGEGFAQMQALKERIETYQFCSNNFSQRIFEFLKQMLIFQADQVIADRTRATFIKQGPYSLQVHPHVQDYFARYRGLTLWTKEMDPRKLNELQQIYVSSMNKLYMKEIRDLLDDLKARMPKKINEDPDHVFTSIATSPASKLANTAALSRTNIAGASATKPLKKPGFMGSTNTVAGSQSSQEADAEEHKAAFLTVPGSRDSGSSGSLSDEKGQPDDAFQHGMALLIPIVAQEQNFASDFFHVYGGGGVGRSTPLCPDGQHKAFQTRSPVASRKAEGLQVKREPTKDVKVAKRIADLMEGIFAGLGSELNTVLELAVRFDASTAVGMLVAVEHFIVEYTGTSQAFVVQTLTILQRRLKSIFDKFIEEQLKAIGETHVTLKRRTGLLHCMRVFPHFVDRMEAEASGCVTGVRAQVDSAYERLGSRTLDTLDLIIKSADASDEKENLNVQIVVLVNMHHFYSEMRGRKLPTLDHFVKTAKQQYDTNLDRYIKDVIRRPLGKLLEFFEGIESLLRTGAPEEVGFHLSYNKAALRKVVAHYPGKEVKKGLETLYRRVEKHFGEEGGLLQVVWRGIQEEFIRRHERFSELMSLCYADSGVALDFTINDLLSYFSELARTH